MTNTAAAAKYLRNSKLDTDSHGSANADFVWNSSKRMSLSNQNTYYYPLICGNGGVESPW